MSLMGRLIVIFISLNLLANCQSNRFRTLPKVDVTKPVKLALVPEIGREERTQFHSRAVNRIYKDGRLLKKVEDVLDFQIESEVLEVDPMADRIEYRVRSRNKKGDGDLREFAFPEPGEKLKIVMNSRTEVMEAGKYPKDSIFYVPTLPLPKYKVEKGDSWKMNAEWVTNTQKFPLKMEVVGILKEYRKCENSHCAIIEISGEVELNGVKDPQLKLDSEIKGYMVFSLARGSVIWSHVRSDQTFYIGNIRNVMNSCLTSYIKEPEVKLLLDQTVPYCGPEDEIDWDSIPTKL